MTVEELLQLPFFRWILKGPFRYNDGMIGVGIQIITFKGFALFNNGVPVIPALGDIILVKDARFSKYDFRLIQYMLVFGFCNDLFGSLPD